MRHRRISRRQLQPRLVRHSRLHRPPHLIIDFQNHPLRPVLPVLLLIGFFHNSESSYDVVHVVALDAIQVKIGGVQFAAQQETPLLVPAEWWPVVVTIFGERFQVPGSVGKFKKAWKEKAPFYIIKYLRGRTWDLFNSR